MANNVAASIGIHGFWGLSASFDCLEAFDRIGLGSGQQDVIRVLLVQPGDIRHIITTLARRLRKRGSSQKLPPIHFYLLESPMEVLSRDIALLDIFMDFEIPIRQRANLFLEVYGNSKVQDRTSRYLERLGERLGSLASAGTSTFSLFDLSMLKYRERDELEAVFRSYSRSTIFDVESLRNQRMRGYYTDRYDSRRALCDWDWQYSVHDTASIIHARLFRDWRESGVSFEFGDQVYTEPNRTLMSYTEGVMKHGKEKGMKKEVRGFWADITCSPYFTFGIDGEIPGKFEEALFEILNKDTGTEQHRHHCVEIAVYNTLAMMWEIETGRQYRMTKNHDIFSGLGTTDGDVGSASSNKTEEKHTLSAIVEEDNTGDALDTDVTGDSNSKLTESIPGFAKDASARAIERQERRKREEEISKEIVRAECVAEALESVKIFPMCGNPTDVLNKPMFRSFFDVMFVSARAAQFMGTSISDKILRSENSKGSALVAVETGKFLIPLLRDQKAEFDRKEKQFCETNGWSIIDPPPVFRRRRDERDVKDDVYFFTKSKKVDNIDTINMG